MADTWECCRGGGEPSLPATAVAWLCVFGSGVTHSFWLSKRAKGCCTKEIVNQRSSSDNSSTFSPPQHFSQEHVVLFPMKNTLPAHAAHQHGRWYSGSGTRDGSFLAEGRCARSIPGQLAPHYLLFFHRCCM